ncbi:sulfatase [Bacteroidota bacterium]
MTTRIYFALLVLLMGSFSSCRMDSEPSGQLPNIILILTDDQGYADVGVFGADRFRTTNLDRMAKEGIRFTSFYVSQPVCTASRASLMTGCYANRVGLTGALNPTSLNGIHPEETILPEILKASGYSTAIFGKWHLGLQPVFNPLQNGFDEYFGLPYSNDNSNDYHPIIRSFPPLPLFDGYTIIETDPDQSQFTRRFTERAIKFIEENREGPFFLYLPHVMPHVPIFASEAFKGHSQAGTYGDVIEEIDWSVGEILSTLSKHNLEENTLIIFLSDNGPWLSYGEHAGSSLPLRGGKLTCFEGGVRVPCIMKWPGKIPENSVCDELLTSMDLLPTIVSIVGAELSQHKIDGKNILPLLTAESEAISPHKAFYYYAGTELHAVRSGDWKLHFPHPYLEVAGEPGKGGKPANFENLSPTAITESGLQGIASRHGYFIKHTELELYNLRDDISESKNLALEYPDVVNKLVQLGFEAREDLGDKLRNQEGKNLRLPGIVQSQDP